MSGPISLVIRKMQLLLQDDKAVSSHPPGKQVRKVELRGLEPPMHGLGKRKVAELALQAVLCSFISSRASV